MTRKTLTLLMLLALCLSVSAQSLLVGTYNIRNNHNDDAAHGNGWLQRCPRICGQVRFEEPDIFGTQEGYIEQLTDMKAQLPGYDFIGVAREDGKQSGEYSAIFYHTGRLQLLEQGNFWLSTTPDVPSKGWDAACTRICTWGKFAEKAGEHRTFYFFNLHMDHVGKVARREAARLVMQKIHALHEPNPNVILTGDFNVDQKDEIYTIFTQSGLLNDAYMVASDKFAENGTYNAYNPDLKTDSRIDHIFVTRNFLVKHYAVMTNCYWSEVPCDETLLHSANAPKEVLLMRYERRLPSDHYPVWAKLGWQ
ncbi:MAG: endonuclease/exonuclease/phosphatase family protein [Bacteroidales bacterium]|nr:endonuclease/exonuclease/phosphatase family protein [Candidatus Equimonas enterica]